MAKETFDINLGKGKQTIEFDSVEDIDNMIDILQTLKKQVNDALAGQEKEEEEPEGELHTFRVIDPKDTDGFHFSTRIRAEYFEIRPGKCFFFVDENIVAAFPNDVFILREDCICKDEEA